MSRTEYEWESFYQEEDTMEIQLEEYLNKNQPKDYKIIQTTNSRISIVAEFEKDE